MKAAAAAARRWLETFELEPLGQGHIHDTYLVSSDSRRLVLQRVNVAVFREPERLMRQTAHLLSRWNRQDRYISPVIELTRDDRAWYADGDQFWRCWSFIPGRMVDPPSGQAQIVSAGEAFGAFQVAMRGIEPALAPTIEGFLDLGFYLRAFDRVAADASADLRRLIDEHRVLVDVFEGDQAAIHGDCKVNNLIYDETDQVRAVIDFDTAMTGHPALDFGDLVRSISFSRGGYRVEDAIAAASGFRRSGVTFSAEHVVDAPRALAFMLGVRFLTDHLSGDRYFRVRRRGENLDRANEQLELLARMNALREATLEAASAMPGPD